MTDFSFPNAVQGDAIVPTGAMQEGADGVSTVRRIDTGTSSAAWEIPTGWAGKMVRIKSLGPQVQVMFSDQTSPSVVYGVTATAAAKTVGETIRALGEIQVWIPTGSVRMAHEAEAAGVLELVLG